jgi:hypothetical protein
MLVLTELRGQGIEMLLRQELLERINGGELRRPHANHVRSCHIPRQIVDEDTVVWGAAELRDDALKRGDLPFRLTHLKREKAPFKDPTVNGLTCKNEHGDRTRMAAHLNGLLLALNGPSEVHYLLYGDVST